MTNPFDLYQNQSLLVKIWRRRYSLFAVFVAVYMWLKGYHSFALCWDLSIGYADLKMKRLIKYYDIDDAPLPPFIKVDLNKLQKAKQYRGERLQPPKVKISKKILQSIQPK